MKTTILMGLMIGALGGCNPGAQTDAAPADMTPSLQATLQFSDSQMSMGAGMMSKSFNFSHLRDLWVRVTVPALPRTAKLQLKFINPRGEVFFEDSAYYSPDGAAGGMNMQGAPQGMTVRPAGKVGTSFTLDRVIPIGGSVFQRFPEAGSWVVEAQLDGFAGVIMSPLEIRTQR